MKKPYAESTLRKKYRKTGIPKWAIDKVHLYLVACANFYRVLDIDEVWKVIKISERRRGKRTEKEILTRELFECVGNHVFEEYIRNWEDIDIIEDGEVSDFMQEGFSKRELQEQLFNKLEEGEEIHKKKIFEICINIMDALTEDGYGYEKGNYVLTREDFDKIIAIKERSCDYYFVLPETDFYIDGDSDVLYLVDVATVLDIEDGELCGFYLDDAEEILDSAFEKEIYIPEEILKYIDRLYFEITPETEAMRELLETHFFSDSDDNMYTEDYEEDANADLKLLLNSIIGNIKDPSLVGNQALSETLEMMEERDYIFEGKENLEQFLQCFMNMSNNTRLPVNKGNTPMELVPAGGLRMPDKITFGPGIEEMFRNGQLDPDEMKRELMTADSLPIELRGNMMREIDKALEPGEERVINYGGTVVKGRKIKPNEPCPCGSGKKYKHCCGK